MPGPPPLPQADRLSGTGHGAPASEDLAGPYDRGNRYVRHQASRDSGRGRRGADRPGRTVVATAGPAAAKAATTQGCPYGAVCIYPQNAGWNGGHPSHFYYSYGAHNLSNMVGMHRIYNNQSGGATMRTCTGYNGTGCQGYLPANNYIDKDMTPINSITLQP